MGWLREWHGDERVVVLLAGRHWGRGLRSFAFALRVAATRRWLGRRGRWVCLVCGGPLPADLAEHRCPDECDADLGEWGQLV